MRSMTGFGRAESTAEGVAVTVEARSVNHRHLDVALRLPRTLGSLEGDARKVVASRVERGRVDVNVQVSPATGEAPRRVQIDGALAREYLRAAHAVAGELELGGVVSVEWLLDRPGVVRLDEVEPPAPTALWPLLSQVLERALDALVQQRASEGAALETALRGLLAHLEVEVGAIAERAPAAARRREERLRDRLRSLVGGLVDESRILTEAAAWAEKTDVTEELTRLRAHMAEVRAMLDKGGPLGRRLDFLIQELHREVTTIGAKADDLEVSQSVLAAKGLVEKLREQTQNVE